VLSRGWERRAGETELFYLGIGALSCISQEAEHLQTGIFLFKATCSVWAAEEYPYVRTPAESGTRGAVKPRGQSLRTKYPALWSKVRTLFHSGGFMWV
jgi:hypothetical protein